jgi:hypothetical protein
LVACTPLPAIASATTEVALASAWASRSRASASRKAASRRPSAVRIADCFSPSARWMLDSRTPSDSRMVARFSRSAFICRPMATTMSSGGAMSLTSMRSTLTPHGPVAWSITASSVLLMSLRFDSASSSAMLPMTLLMLVSARLVMAR